MRPLVIIFSSASQERSDTALALAASHAALDEATHLHLDRRVIRYLSDQRFIEAIEEVRALGGVVTLCPTGVAEQSIEPEPFPDADRIGLVALLAELPDDARLVVV